MKIMAPKFRSQPFAKPNESFLNKFRFEGKCSLESKAKDSITHLYPCYITVEQDVDNQIKMKVSPKYSSNLTENSFFTLNSQPDRIDFNDSRNVSTLHYFQDDLEVRIMTDGKTTEFPWQDLNRINYISYQKKLSGNCSGYNLEGLSHGKPQIMEDPGIDYFPCNWPCCLV